MKNLVLGPSANCKPGADLLGIVRGNGKIGLLPRPLKVDHEFVEIANQGRRPEKRFRFAAPCLECRCQQWSKARCGVIGRCSAELSPQANTLMKLPECTIRSQCGWFYQNGAAACEICPEVVTDVSEGWVDNPGVQGAPQLLKDSP
ncbi:MAG: hypothetical protein ABSG59_00395 [Verrucomicrobiota bacterium]|jgi:hypothetical protein